MKTFVEDALERAVKTFAQGLLGFFIGDATVLNIHWNAALAVSATMALTSVLTSVVSLPLGGEGTASLVSRVTSREKLGKHAEP
jgi:hypothetical protein